MKTDLEVITGTIVEILRCPPSTRIDGCGYTEWEKDRRSALAALYLKLEAAPFYAITTTYPDDPELEPDAGFKTTHIEPIITQA